MDFSTHFMIRSEGCTLSAEKIFCECSSVFLFVFLRLFAEGLVFWALFLRFLGALLCCLA
jgi:hypothetical protein